MSHWQKNHPKKKKGEKRKKSRGGRKKKFKKKTDPQKQKRHLPRKQPCWVQGIQQGHTPRLKKGKGCVKRTGFGDQTSA